MYKLTRNVLVQTTGFSRSAGQPIGRGEIRDDKLWQAWLDEGIVVEEASSPLPSKPETKVEAPLPQNVGASLSKTDNELRTMSMDELKKLGKRLGIRSVHLYKSRDKLIEKIEALS